jgi:hypothetical protein
MLVACLRTLVRQVERAREREGAEGEFGYLGKKEGRE